MGDAFTCTAARVKVCVLVDTMHVPRCSTTITHCDNMLGVEMQIAICIPTHCNNTMQHHATATHHNSTSQHTATEAMDTTNMHNNNTLQHAATTHYSNTMQHSATDIVAS